MMMKRFQILYLTVIALVFSAPLYAQSSLPTFKPDPAIVQGQLPDGIRYYMVTNRASKGYADFALVRKGFDDVTRTRAALTNPEGFHGLKAYRFLSDKGIGYQPFGYTAYRDGSTVSVFRGVPAYDAAAADSTLLVLFDMIRAVQCPQAIIISGDIDASKLADRMYMLSMTIPMLPPETPSAPYEWKPIEGLVFSTSEVEKPGVSEIRVLISAPRVPSEYMNTPQPFVTEMFVSELETILTRRLKRAFRDAGVPLGSIRLLHEDSSEKGGDETYSISICTDSGSVEKALQIAGSVLGGIDAGGVTAGEYLQARDRLISYASSADMVQTNEMYVQKCANSYLYGASLVSLEEICNFMTRRRLPVDKELEFFNNFSSALLDPGKSISVDCTLPAYGRSAEQLKTVFENAWAGGDTRDYAIADTLSLSQLKSKTKIKLKSEAPDPITGGVLWTFSNGMKVIFKKADTKGRLEYGLMVKGGTPNVPSLKQGEAGFVAETFNSFDIAGIRSDDFADLLASNGITMDLSVSVSDLRIKGSSPSSELPFLLKALLSVSTDRKLDKAQYEYYRKCEAVSLAEADFDVNSELEHMSSPDYLYSGVREIEGLSPNLPERTAQYFDSQFSRINDGVFVLVGDYDEVELQKLLVKSLGNFQCGKASLTRSKVSMETRHGWYTRSYEGKPCVAVSLNALDPFSMDGYMAFRVASTALRKEIVKVLSDEGMYAEFDANAEFFPLDSYSIVVRCYPCEMDGLPSDITEQKVYRTLDAVRRAVNRISSSEITDAEVKAYKAALKNEMTSYYASPSSLIDAAMIRHSLGRDVVSKYAEHIDAVSVNAVKAVLSSLNEGSRMEVVVR